MSQWSGEAFRLAGPLFVLAWLLAWLLFTPLRRRMRRRRIVPDEPAGTPYRVFAADSDADIPAHEAVRFVLDRNRDQPDGAAATIGSWQARIEERDRIFRELGPHWDRDCGQLWPEFEAALAGTSVLVLCDQSGSMRDRIIGYGAGLRWLYAQLAGHGVSTMIAGFTTSEWQGGAPRRAWLEQGKPARPGRLCPLLYLRYAEFERQPIDEDWDAMMHPSLLRENVDGEALLWAEDRLRSHPSGRRVLVVLSDGASVDDSTLNENGRSYLERHLQKAVSEIDERQTAVLCAIGLDFRVDRYYRRATFVDDPKALPAAVLRAIGAAMMTQAIGQDKKRLVQHES